MSKMPHKTFTDWFADLPLKDKSEVFNYINNRNFGRQMELKAQKWGNQIKDGLNKKREGV